MISKVSSANWIIGKSVVYPTLIGSLKIPMSLALLMMDCRRSAGSMKRSGDNGSPCLTPPPLAMKSLS
jgi:hypothetical protein